MPDAVHASIHHYFPHPETGHIDYDEEGDPIMGWYFQVIDNNGLPLTHLIGPYGSSDEAEEACEKAWATGDW